MKTFSLKAAILGSAALLAFASHALALDASVNTGVSTNTTTNTSSNTNSSRNSSSGNLNSGLNTNANVNAGLNSNTGTNANTNSSTSLSSRSNTQGVAGVRSTDESLGADVRSRFSSDARFRSKGINTEVRNGILYLSGDVMTESERDNAEKFAGSISGVSRVQNDLRVSSRTTANHN